MIDCQKTKIEELKVENQILKQKRANIFERGKINGIQEFAERLIGTADGDDEYGTVFVFSIEDLAKEMTKGKKHE